MKILAVDDDLIILELLREFFAVIGEHELITSDSPEEALMIASTTPDIQCFLLDIQMPGMDGIELCQALRKMPRFKRTPVLMLTAMSEKRYIDNAFAAGATDYVTKPFELSELQGRIQLVASLVQERRSGSERAAVSYPGRNRVRRIVPQLTLDQPFEINDVKGVIEAHALENYLQKLTRSAMFGSTIFAFAIRDVEKLFHSIKPYDFRGVISDVAEALSDCLVGNQFLMAYLGNGLFGCVTEDGWMPDLDDFVSRTQIEILKMGLYSSDGTPLDVEVVHGKALRLDWRSSSSVLTAFEDIVDSARHAALCASAQRQSRWPLRATA
ncbi:response regulator [Frigidibacter sp. ROC022]|uniref:response regulator n=1 Tax=Frigidibacter sp. ROC022 TaxID=2971796 RepID=UPI00215ABE09|nr:response regulator [Frigidibacter sp. ROC022]MCR8726089.1 response regulator [Frigidibacter sp. ROC022]